MVNPRCVLLCLVLAALCFLDSPAYSQVANLIGLNLLQASTTNLNGSGIPVAQVEADTSVHPDPSYFEVNPTNAVQAPGVFTYISASGGAAGFTNAVGLESGHADTVACCFYGINSGIATNVAHVFNYDATYYIYQVVGGGQPANGERIVNQSFTLGTEGSQAQFDSMYDNFEENHNTLFVSAVGAGPNNVQPCAPGTAYNCISVGAYQNGSFDSNIGPTADNGRCKPDITAIAGATSFSTPQVSGAAAILMQAALRGDGGSDTNSAFNNRTIKALLLNGAVKPSGWTNSSLSPLDARYGSGVVNIYNSYRLLAAGKQSSIASSLVPSGNPHPPIGSVANEPDWSGWDFNTNSSSTNTDSICHYYFNLTNSLPREQFTLTTTLVWNRHIHQSVVNNLALYLYNCANSNVVACSTSLVDNVQHIYLPVLNPGRYDLQVWKAGGTNIVSTAEPYALSWQIFAHHVTMHPASGGALISWPMYPAGFNVLSMHDSEDQTPLWTNIDMSSLTYTNGTNTVFVPCPYGAEFFRLASPNL